MNTFKDNIFEENLIELMPMIRGIVSTFPANMREDLIQEGILGLNNALRSYNESLGVPFKQFARTCIKNSVYTAYKKFCKDENLERIDEEHTYDDNELLEDNVIRKKDTEDFFIRLRTNLSGLESKILTEYLSDKSYEVIAAGLGVSVKTVDNSLTRIKNKIKKLYE